MPRASTGLIGINLDWKTIIAAALVGAGAIWLAKKGIEKGVEAAKENLDPTKESNIFNRAFEHLYKGTTGSEQSLGADLWEWLHKSPEPESKQQTGIVWEYDPLAYEAPSPGYDPGAVSQAQRDEEELRAAMQYHVEVFGQ